MSRSEEFAEPLLPWKSNTYLHNESVSVALVTQPVLLCHISPLSPLTGTTFGKSYSTLNVRFPLQRLENFSF
jgi:hypothetical protein